jgi:NitT/TauT family transport system substrate-binding protein
MQLRIVSAAVFVLASLFASEGQAEKIRTATPSGSLNYLSIYVAEERGFFKDGGLENETVVIPGPTGIAALLSGDVDYSGAGGSGMRAAVKGAPIKAILFQTEKVTWYLVVGPSISRLSDLKGKKIAIGATGDTLDTLVTTLAEREGLSAKDITRIAMGPSAITRISAVKADAVQATALDPASTVMAENEGLRILTYLGDLFPFPFQGFMTTEKKIAENSGQIKRWLRAMIQALMFIRERPEGATDIGMKRLRLKSLSRAMVMDAVKRFNKALPDGIPGMPMPEGIKNVLEYDVRIPLKMREKIPPEKVLDFRWIQEVKRELEIQSRGR